MDMPQLKLLAGRVRDLLQQANHSIGHNQSLDLIAALPGLRNWPEVMAFPDRVIACELDASSASRLTFRLKKKFDLDLSPQALIAAISPSFTAQNARSPQIWPSGPKPGVYVTTSQAAINALIQRYEDATDGALIYAESAGDHYKNSINLGEGGLWSSGLSRVPSGTLIVVGPVELNQQSWDQSADRLEMACLHAQTAEHRIAVLIETPTPEAMCEDVSLMVQTVQPEDDDCHTALIGIVTEDGELQKREPFYRPRPGPTRKVHLASIEAIPHSALGHLRKVTAECSAGVLLFGSSIIEEHPAIDLVVASLALTKHLGPVARIMPRKRSTPAKDWQVPQAIAQLPFLPSIESAYDQGYRRIVFNPNYTSADTLVEFSKDALLIAGTYGRVVEDVFMNGLRGGGLKQEVDLLERIIAILGITSVTGKQENIVVSDLFMGQRDIQPVDLKKFDDVFDFLQKHRILKWEEELSSLIDSGIVTANSLKKSLPRDRYITEFLAQRPSTKKAS